MRFLPILKQERKETSRRLHLLQIVAAWLFPPSSVLPLPRRLPAEKAEEGEKASPLLLTEKHKTEYQDHHVKIPARLLLLLSKRPP